MFWAEAKEAMRHTDSSRASFIKLSGAEFRGSRLA